MKAVVRIVIALILSCSIAFAAVPRQPLVSGLAKTDCCAKMKTESSAHECQRHAPKPDQDQQCCALCAFGLALLTTVATPFVYPPTGDQTFAAFISSGHLRSDRPPVPPPRA
jgi:hypothetical protein